MVRLSGGKHGGFNLMRVYIPSYDRGHPSLKDSQFDPPLVNPWTDKTRHGFTWGAVLCLLFLAACTPTPGGAPPPGGTAGNAALSALLSRSPREKEMETVLASGYRNIHERYVTPLTVDEVALNGLSGLATLDPAVSVTPDAGGLHLRRRPAATPSGTPSGDDQGHTASQDPARPKTDGTEQMTEDPTTNDPTRGDTADITLPLPEEGDSRAWARATVQAVTALGPASPALAAVAPEDLYRAVFEAALSPLDRFSRYVDAASARFARSSRNGFGGIGVRLRIREGIAQVLEVLPGTPASKVNMAKGDRIIEIDGKTIAHLSQADIIGRLRGAVGSSVILTLARPLGETPPPDTGTPQHPAVKPDPKLTDPFAGAQRLQVTLGRQLIIPETVTSRRDGDIGYLRVSSFNAHTAQDATAALTALAAKRPLAAIVLDLRDNPGGLLDQAVVLADLFLEAGDIVMTRGRHPHATQHFTAGGDDVAVGLPMAVLLNSGSASASEIVGAALQDQGRAVVIGSISYGKGSVQSVVRLPNDGELVLTWSHLYAPSGYSMHKLGVLPTICTTSADGLQASSQTAMQAISQTDTSDLPAARLIADLPARYQAMHQVQIAWRGSHGPDRETRLATLRAACPARAQNTPHDRPEADTDLAVARYLLTHPDLYERALEVARPTLATRPASPPS